MKRLSIHFLAILMLVQPCFANAQQESEGPETARPAPESNIAAPYDDKLLRLSEVLGSIHYLRALCGAKEGNRWRDRMGQIIASEKPQPSRQARLIARFNRGYRAFDQTYSTCTNSALTAASRYMKEGVLLSSQITSRYGR